MSGPGGAGKGTVAARLIEADPTLWLSRSWTTRPRREGEAADAYSFVDRRRFESAVERGAFLEHAEFLGHLYGTPVPDVPPGRDLLLEIDRQGAEQVKARFPETVVILLVPPSDEVQAERLRRRGDDEEAVARRLRTGKQEVAALRRLADHEVVNDDLNRVVDQLTGIIADHRRSAPAAPGEGSAPGGP